MKCWLSWSYNNNNNNNRTIKATVVSSLSVFVLFCFLFIVLVWGTQLTPLTAPLFTWLLSHNKNQHFAKRPLSRHTQPIPLLPLRLSPSSPSLSFFLPLIIHMDVCGLSFFGGTEMLFPFPFPAFLACIYQLAHLSNFTQTKRGTKYCWAIPVFVIPHL